MALCDLVRASTRPFPACSLLGPIRPCAVPWEVGCLMLPCCIFLLVLTIQPQILLHFPGLLLLFRASISIGSFMVIYCISANLHGGQPFFSRRCKDLFLGVFRHRASCADCHLYPLDAGTGCGAAIQTVFIEWHYLSFITLKALICKRGMVKTPISRSCGENKIFKKCEKDF